MNPPDIPPSGRPVRRHRNTAVDWEHHRESIRQLYMVENKSLEETINTMARSRNFQASSRAYKDKLKQWGMEKNISAQDMEFMLGKASKRQRERNVKTAFLNRNRNQWVEFERLQRANTPPHIAYETPRSGDAGLDSSSDTDDEDLSGKAYAEYIEDLRFKLVHSVVAIRFCQPSSFDTDFSAVGEATGFVVDVDAGLILTTRQVVCAGPFWGYCVFRNDERCDLQPVYRDPVHDFGILKFDPKKIKHTTVAALMLDPDSPRVGLDIDVVGYPATRELKNVSGVISQMHSEPPRHNGMYVDFNTDCIRAALGGAAQSPGSPMIDLNGNAIALKMGRMSEKNYTDHFLPLHRPVRALQYIRRNEAVPRGTIQVVWQSVSFDACRAKGLGSTWLDHIRRTDPKRTTMLVASIVLPEGPSDTKLQNDDILIKVNGALIHQHIPLEEIIDSNVGNTIDLLVHRGGRDLEFTVQVGDLHSLTPDRFVTVAGGVFHTVSYQQAQRHNVAARGVYLCDKIGGTFGPRRGLIVQKINQRLVPDLETFIHIMTSLRDRSRVMLDYEDVSTPNVTTGIPVQIDRHWYPKMTLSVRNDRTGRWDVTTIGNPLPAIRPVPATASFMRMSWPNQFVSDIVRSIVTVECTMPLKLDGCYSNNATGMGLVIDAKVGLVVASRVTVPFDLCNVSITIAENIVVDGRVVFLHPQQNYSIIQYDPTLVDAPVQSAKLSTKVARQGADVIFVGVDPLDGQLRLANTKITGVSTYICKPDYGSPSYRCEHVDAITVDTRLAAFCPSGVLLSFDGTVEALWLEFLSADNEEQSRGLDTSALFPVINEIRRGKIPGLRILDLTTESISMSIARSLGLGERWISQVMIENPSMHQLFMVSKTDAMLARKLTQWNKENRPFLCTGDVILTLNGRLITRNSDFDVMYNELYLDVLVLRNGNEVHLRYPTVSVQETSRAVIFGGAQLQAPHRAVKQAFTRLHSGIYISNITQSGSPADFFGLRSNTFITAVNEKETETLDDFLREASKIPGDNYFTAQIVDIKNTQSSVTVRKNDHYFPTMEYIKTGLSRWKLITYGEQGRITDETDVINDIFATSTDTYDLNPNNSLEANFPMGDSVMEDVRVAGFGADNSLLNTGFTNQWMPHPTSHQAFSGLNPGESVLRGVNFDPLQWTQQ